MLSIDQKYYHPFSQQLTNLITKNNKESPDQVRSTVITKNEFGSYDCSVIYQYPDYTKKDNTPTGKMVEAIKHHDPFQKRFKYYD